VPTAAAEARQEIRFCRSPDGARIAYAVHGSGPPLLVSTCWLSHLQHDWESPVWRHFLEDIGAFATIIRFDERGHGLSDWDVTDHSLEARLGDLEAVADDAGLESFTLMAMAQGGPVAITYTARHPERVDRLVFYDSYATATEEDDEPEALELEDTFGQLIKVGWARPDSTFRRVFTSLMIPGATEEQMQWLDELQRVTCSASTAYSAREQRRLADARALLPDLDLPTLVLHSIGDRMNDFESGRRLAAGIAGSRLVALPSDNHIVLADEPAWQILVTELRAFLGASAAGQVSAPEPAAVGLTEREREVLDLAARGLDNDEIAAALTLSVRTVERHLQNTYVKLGVGGRSARAAAVAYILTTT
jgi:pimeloyl-ACP methyl ester carboxylesterase/DNA-binding CsgD family transcriptional regulator